MHKNEFETIHIVFTRSQRNWDQLVFCLIIHTHTHTHTRVLNGINMDMVLNNGRSRTDIFTYISNDTKNKTAENIVKEQRNNTCDGS